ncbi:unnamed protein product [Amoebophrya sp. A120]|nr:unnamed protein product [Amoebophrya sp. A120]|eukprot:GSA120T00017667001.1
MTTAHRPTFTSRLGGENAVSGNLMVARTTKQSRRDHVQELTMKTRTVEPKTRAEMIEEMEEREQNQDGASSLHDLKSRTGKSSTSDAGGGTSSRIKKSGIGGVGGIGTTAASSKSVIQSNDGFKQLPVIEGDNPFPEDADADFDSQSEDEKPRKAGKGGKDSEDEDGDSDSDSDSDYEELQRELAKIRPAGEHRKFQSVALRRTAGEPVPQALLERRQHLQKPGQNRTESGQALHQRQRAQRLPQTLFAQVHGNVRSSWIILCSCSSTCSSVQTATRIIIPKTTPLS